MKVKLICTAFILTALLLLPINLYAFGIGTYGSASLGKYYWSYQIRNNPDSSDPKIESYLYTIGFGLMMDTNLSSDKRFNYRLHAGYSLVHINNKNNNESNYTVYDISGKEKYFYNSFGYGLIRNESIRFWLGLQVGFGEIDGKYDLPASMKEETNDFSVLFYSIGIIVGINFNIGEFITLGLDGGLRYPECYAYAETSNMSPYLMEVKGSGTEVFINLCFMFRLNEPYRN
jgi:hypothetical protein